MIRKLCRLEGLGRIIIIYLVNAGKIRTMAEAEPATQTAEEQPAAQEENKQGEEKKREEGKAWDGTDLLSAEELKRQEALFTPLQDDIWEW